MRAPDDAEENIVRMTGTDGPDRRTSAWRSSQDAKAGDGMRRHATSGTAPARRQVASEQRIDSVNSEENAPLGHSVRRGTIGNGHFRRVSELASGLTRNQVPRKGLWVRIPCPPLLS